VLSAVISELFCPPDKGEVFMDKPARSINYASGIVALFFLIVGLFAGCQLGGASTSTSSPSSSSAPSAADEDSIREAVIAKVRPSVVQINIITARGGGVGSGVIIDPRGYIVTNNHVVEGAQNVEVVLFSGEKVSAEITGTDPLDDLAVVKIGTPRVHLAVANLGDSATLKVGQTVLAIGNPLGITQTATSGIVSALDRNVSEGSSIILPHAIQTDAAINPGNSGGALVDLQSDLVGIPTLTAIDPQFKTPANGVGFAIPSNRVKFITPQLISAGRVVHTGRAALGIQVASVDPIVASQNNLPVDHGALIASVNPGGPAAKAGLKVGDIIVQINNQAVSDAPSLGEVLLNSNPGSVVQVHFYRGNQQMTANVTLGELSAG
jgi:putative serine protease PepD